MNRLIVMRHAKAEPADLGMDDHDRPLARRGHIDAAAMARALAKRGFAPDRALVSSSLRTRETWEAVSGAFGDVEVDVRPGLYNADPNELRDAVDAEADASGCLMVIAHNPGVHLFALDLAVASAAPGSALDRLQNGFPTSAAAVFAMDERGRYGFEGLITPADLADRA